MQPKARANYYKIAITRAELQIAVDNRTVTGESINGFVRRLIRQYPENGGEGAGRTRDDTDR